MISAAELERGRVVAHLDCDAFFYSVECLHDPSLVGKAVVVSSTSPRAVVTTASYEARKYGASSGMPLSKAMRLCPQALIIPPHFEFYRAKSKEVWELVRTRLGRELQHVSLDEAYVELTGLEGSVELVRKVIAEVKERTGITISVGIGPSRLVAKCCSDFEKPEGFVVMSREDACTAFADQPPRALPGIGPKTAERLLAIGVGTLWHLQHTSEVDLIEVFGLRSGRELKARAYFYDQTPVVTERVLKSKSVENTFDTDVSDGGFVREELTRLADKLAEQLQVQGRRGRTIGIKVRLRDWTTVTRERSLDEFTNERERIAQVALQLLSEYDPAQPIRLLGVRVSSFEDALGPVVNPAAPLQVVEAVAPYQQLTLDV
jgi:DNA polymerase-4